MEITVKFDNSLGLDFDANRGKEVIISRTRASLDCFDTLLRDVIVRIRDLNGDKGGIDIECLIVLSLHNKKPVHVRAVAATVEQSLSHALRKASSVVSKRKEATTTRRTVQEVM